MRRKYQRHLAFNKTVCLTRGKRSRSRPLFPLSFFLFIFHHDVVFHRDDESARRCSASISVWAIRRQKSPRSREISALAKNSKRVRASHNALVLAFRHCC